MSAYNVALFIHLLGAVTFFIAMGLMQVGGAQMRRASTLEHVRLSLGVVRSTRSMFPLGLLVLLLSGLYMTADAWTFETPWVVVGIITLIVIGVVGGGVVGRRFGVIGRSAAGDGPVPPELARRISEPANWVFMTALNGLAIGMLWLMTNKPGWAGAIGVIVAGAVIGGAIGSLLARRGAMEPAGSRG